MGENAHLAMFQNPLKIFLAVDVDVDDLIGNDLSKDTSGEIFMKLRLVVSS